MTLNQIKLIAFDLDDTLWPNDGVIEKSEQALSNHLHTTYPTHTFNTCHIQKTKEQVLSKKPELSHRVSDFRRAVISDLLLPMSLTDHYDHVEKAFEVFLEARQQVTPFSDAVTTLQTLSEHYRLATFSNGNADVTKTKLGHFFEVNLNGDKVGFAKPSPEAFMALCEQTKLPPYEIAYVGDHWHFDVEGASNVGMQAIWMNPKNLPPASNQHTLYSIQRLSDLLTLLNARS